MRNNKAERQPQVEQCQTTRADYFTGTKEQLIAARVAEPGWFPRKLEPMWRKDGKPNMRNGRQRCKRTYTVEGRKPETTLSLTYSISGGRTVRTLWTLRIAVSEKEQGRREAAERENERENERRREAEAERLLDLQPRSCQESHGEQEPRPKTTNREVMWYGHAPIEMPVFKEGEWATYFWPGHNGHLDRCKLVSEYGYHRCNGNDGVVRPRWGYIVRFEDDKENCFATANNLREYAHKPAHLRLVVNNTKGGIK